MKKYNFLIFHSEYEDFLHRLRDLNVVHINERPALKGDQDLSELLSKQKEVQEFIKKVSARKKPEAVEKTGTCVSEQLASDAYMRCQSLFDDEAKAAKEVEMCKRLVDVMEPWGEFSSEILSKFESIGYKIDFYTCSASSFQEEWIESYGAIFLNQVKSTIYFMTIRNDFSNGNPNSELVKLPPQSLSTLMKEQEQAENTLSDIQNKIKDFASEEIYLLKSYLAFLEDKFSFGAALLSGDKHADGHLILLEGWCPLLEADAMEAEVKQLPCYMEELEITDEDTIPIKLKNNFFSRLFEPITKMFSLPNYNELDPTPFFAPFFMLFFGLCCGDAGYGLVVLCVSLFFVLKLKPGSMRDIVMLTTWLGGTATVVGLLVGTIFGVPLPWANPEVHPDYFLNQQNLMTLSIVIGLVQILYGKFLAAYKVQIQRGFKYAVAPYAWVFFFVTAAISYGISVHLADVIAANKILNYVLMGVPCIFLFIAFFFNSPGKNPLVNAGSGLWAAYNMASGLLGDSLSYIRLFAIGLTGGILGGVFNMLAMQMLHSMPLLVGIIVMLIVLIVGHSINFGLTMISSLVHPLRLTFVEFYKNEEFEGGGKEYKPFRKKA